MIFIVLIIVIAAVIIGLNMHDNSNLKKIEDYLVQNNCNSYIYTKGSYKAFCEDKLLEIGNSFTIDIKKNSKVFKYTDIKDVEIKKLDIIIDSKDSLEFKTKDELDKFYIELENRLKNRT